MFKLDVISIGIGFAIGFVLGFIIAYIVVTKVLSKEKKEHTMPIGQTQPQIQPQPMPQQMGLPQQPHFPPQQMQMHPHPSSVSTVTTTPSQPIPNQPIQSQPIPNQPLPPYPQYPQPQTQQAHVQPTMQTSQYPIPQPNIPPQPQVQPMVQQQTPQITQTTQTVQQPPQVSQPSQQQTTVQVETQVSPKPTEQPTTQPLEPKVEPQPHVQPDVVQPQPEKPVEPKEEEDRFHKGKKCRLCGTPLEEGDTCKGCTAKVALSMAENSIAELKAEGAKVYVDAKIKDAKTALDNNDFENAIKIAHEIQEQGKDIGQKFSEAKRQLDAAKSTLTEVEKAGVDVSQARTTLTLATSFFEDGEYDKCLRYGVKAERLAKDLADKAKVTMKKPSEPAPTTQPTAQPTGPSQQKQETPQPTSMKATLCNICRGVIKPGLPIIKCSCGRQFHEACASRVGDCPSCGRKI